MMFFENQMARPSSPRMQVVPEKGVDFLCSRRASSASQVSVDDRRHHIGALGVVDQGGDVARAA